MTPSNELCFSASAGGCHADMPSGGTSGYPAQESDRMPSGSAQAGYFEYNLGGIRAAGIQNRVRWPGRSIWENPTFSPHYSDNDMPIKDLFGNGSCDNCHNVHGSEAVFDMLDTTYFGIIGSELGHIPENYALCLTCHTPSGPVSMDDTSQTIAYFYDRSINPSTRSGHGISSGGGYLAAGQRLPCYDCHNPHGSIGNGGSGGNAYLLSDERWGWFDLTDIKYDNDQVRRFCFGCHPSSDLVAPASSVEGIVLPSLPASVSAHKAGANTHCYDCHGRDYSTPNSHNVHNPEAGGDCISCHSGPQGTRRAIVDEFNNTGHHVFAVGQSGSISTNDCGVCHMEGDAATGSINSSYHRNGLVELRDPDNGTAITGFSSFTRDRSSAFLEPWVLDVQNRFCLTCHDNNGALSLAAQVPGGSSQSPFSDPGAIVSDVNSAFNPANASTHPVRMPGNNQYTVPSSANEFTITMQPPFNQGGVHDVISCFDCHETSGHGSQNSGMLVEETYFREPTLHPAFADAQKVFCIRCHDDRFYIDGSGKGSRFEKHDKGPHVGMGSEDSNQMSCRGCHAGIYDMDDDPGCGNGSGVGRIHGFTHVYSGCSATPGQNPPAFLFGGHLKGWEKISESKNNCYANCHHPDGEDY